MIFRMILSTRMGRIKNKIVIRGGKTYEQNTTIHERIRQRTAEMLC